MVKVLCSVAFILWLSFLQAQTPFITTWKTDNPGTSCDACITIHTTGTGYDYAVDWNNDGVFDTSGVTGDVTHDFGMADTVTIQIRGDFPRIYFNNAGDREKILSIDQWGDNITWGSMENAFYGCSNLMIPAGDAPNLSLVSSMSQMFRAAYAFNNAIDHWDVSSVKNMSSLFHEAIAFNHPLNGWDVSSVINMAQMFFRATNFNKPLNSWNVSSVTNMVEMFCTALAFNQPLDSLDVSSVTGMIRMFAYTSAFNQPLSSWDVSSVTDMSSMFFRASSFNHPLDGWDITAVSDMIHIFDYSPLDTRNYDLTLIGWSSLNVQSNVLVGATGLTFCAIDAHNILENNFNWTFGGDMPGLASASSFTPSTGDWYGHVNNWSTMAFPTFCTDVTIPSSKSVTLLTGEIGTANTLTVDLGGELDVPLGAELLVEH